MFWKSLEKNLPKTNPTDKNIEITLRAERMVGLASSFGAGFGAGVGSGAGLGSGGGSGWGVVGRLASGGGCSFGPLGPDIDFMATAACFRMQSWPQYTESGRALLVQPGPMQFGRVCSCFTTTFLATCTTKFSQ